MKLRLSKQKKRWLCVVVSILLLFISGLICEALFHARADACDKRIY